MEHTVKEIKYEEARKSKEGRAHHACAEIKTIIFVGDSQSWVERKGCIEKKHGYGEGEACREKQGFHTVETGGREQEWVLRG